MLPDALPATVGAKVTVKVEVAPAFIVKGAAVTPLSANPVPEADTFETVTATVPALVSVMSCGSLPLTTTLPKATLAGLADSCP